MEVRRTAVVEKAIQEFRPGRKFRDWTALGVCKTRTPEDKGKGIVVLCICKCGKPKRLKASRLRKGATNNCGCWRKEPRPWMWGKPFKSGPGHKNFKHGRYKTRDGYIAVQDIMPGEKTRRRLQEHRLIMAKHLGRPLTRDETVHHVNGNRADNRIENLELWTSRHPRGQRVEDKIDFVIEILKQYAPEHLSKDLT